MLIAAIRANVGLEDFERRLSRARSTATPTISTNSPLCRVFCTSALGHRSTTLDLLLVPLAPFLLSLSLSLTYKLETIAALFTDRALCTRSHRTTGTCSPWPILSNLIGPLILFRHSRICLRLFPACLERKRQRARAFFVDTVVHTRAVLGTRAV